MYYGYRRGFYGAWGGSGYETHVDQYVEGTVNVDIVDASASNWYGKAWPSAASPRRPRKRQAAIHGAVAEMFAKYPFRTGG